MNNSLITEDTYLSSATEMATDGARFALLIVLALPLCTLGEAKVRTPISLTMAKKKKKIIYGMLESLTLFISYSDSSRPKGYQLAWTIGGHALHSRCTAD